MFSLSTQQFLSDKRDCRIPLKQDPEKLCFLVFIYLFRHVLLFTGKFCVQILMFIPSPFKNSEYSSFLYNYRTTHNVSLLSISKTDYFDIVSLLDVDCAKQVLLAICRWCLFCKMEIHFTNLLLGNALSKGFHYNYLRQKQFLLGCIFYSSSYTQDRNWSRF